MSGFREPLDVSEIVSHYREFLDGESTVGINHIRHDPEYQGDPYSFGPVPQRYKAPEESVDDPLLVGDGPSVCSSSLTVAQGRPVLAWDPNRYYRSLGIPWPYVHATRKDLREAFYARDGHSSHWLTHCLKMLLDPGFRAYYDALPLGERNLDDPYIQDELKAKAADESGRRARQGKQVRPEDVLDEWGYKLTPESNELAEQDVLDNDRFNRFDDDNAPHGPDGADWGFAYYLWKTHRRAPDLLSAWQTSLVSFLGASERPPAIAVGLLGREPHEYVIAQVKGTWVVFLNQKTEVSAALAKTAANALQRQISDQHETCVNEQGEQ